MLNIQPKVGICCKLGLDNLKKFNELFKRRNKYCLLFISAKKSTDKMKAHNMRHLRLKYAQIRKDVDDDEEDDLGNITSLCPLLPMFTLLLLVVTFCLL